MLRPVHGFIDACMPSQALRVEVSCFFRFVIKYIAWKKKGFHGGLAYLGPLERVVAVDARGR